MKRAAPRVSPKIIRSSRTQPTRTSSETYTSGQRCVSSSSLVTSWPGRSARYSSTASVLPRTATTSSPRKRRAFAVSSAKRPKRIRRSRSGREDMRQGSRPRAAVTNRRAGKCRNDCRMSSGPRETLPIKSRPMSYRVHGMMQSYFTRKMTGYFDYKGIPWVFRRFAGASPEAMAAGFPGGVPVVEMPGGEFMWDSTAMIHHLELRFPERAVLPQDPVQRFLCYVIEDAADEWLYRTAVGSRWFFPENAAVGGFELARDISVRMPVACDQAHVAVGEHVRSSCPPLGVTAETIQLWIDDVLRPWLRIFGAHLACSPYLFGT